MLLALVDALSHFRIRPTKAWNNEPVSDQVLLDARKTVVDVPLEPIRGPVVAVRLLSELFGPSRKSSLQLVDIDRAAVCAYLPWAVLIAHGHRTGSLSLPTRRRRKRTRPCRRKPSTG